MAAPITSAPVVSVIVPARNEEANLGACLRSIVSQTGVSFEVIVVDDGSTDGTREIADSFAEVRTIAAPLPPSGWTGKNNAVVAGQKIAHGEWMLFTDADTVHLPGSLARALEEAKQHGVALLSYSPKQVVHGFWEMAVMPVVFAELASSYRPSEVSDPASPAAAANGQYILVSREAYDAAGGHAAVATSLLEDVALARTVKASGRKIRFRFGGDAVRTRMYRGFAQLREGWTKNLVLLFPAPGRLALRRAVEFLSITICSAAAIAAAVEGKPQISIGLLCVSLALFGRFIARIRKAHFSVVSTALSLAGLPVLAYLLLRSHLFHLKGAVTWKGRTYGPIHRNPAPQGQ